MNPYVAVVLQNLLPVFVTLLVIPILFVLMKFVIKKLNLHLDEEQEKKIGTMLTEALTYAEEWARGKIKTGTKPTGAEKLEQALAYAISEMERRGWNKWVIDQLTKKLTAALGLARDPNAPPPVAPPAPAAPAVVVAPPATTETPKQ